MPFIPIFQRQMGIFALALLACLMTLLALARKTLGLRPKPCQGGDPLDPATRWDICAWRKLLPRAVRCFRALCIAYLDLPFLRNH